MADYNSSYTGVQIDDAVGKSLAALPVDNTLSTTGKAADAKKTGDELNDLKRAKAPVIIDTASGAVASFDDGADGMPIKSLTVNIEPVQAGSGDPSPQNVRPISGWTGCNIYHSGADMSNPTTYTIAFPTEAGTVYGGALDVTNGVLMVDKVDLHTNLAAGTWTKNGSFWQMTWGSSLPTLANLKILCDTYKNLTPSGSVTQDNIIGFLASGSTLRLRDNSLTTLADVQAKLANIQAIFQLASPITYQLTPQEATTLLGTNNIWADCGPVDVDYPADTKLYIQKVNKPTDDDMTADARIESGRYFIIGNTLYLSTTDILAGDTIIPGTNCTKTDLAAALNALNT